MFWGFLLRYFADFTACCRALLCACRFLQVGVFCFLLLEYSKWIPTVAPERRVGIFPWTEVSEKKTCRCKFQAFTQKKCSYTQCCRWYMPLRLPLLLPLQPHTHTHTHTTSSHPQPVFLFISHSLLALSHSCVSLAGFPLAYLKFPPGHKVLHSAEDFYRRSLGMGQSVMERETNSS